ncbi:phosphate metabolism protein 8 [Diospyros lotus]|uniref:phosphate metabolism protein 8 n=1 Tax=Diospyros lotus TaxID=55363 RepID=UPI0022591B12|nr:phosphate metabolism protein 8 [Diospyros lotus]
MDSCSKSLPDSTTSLFDCIIFDLDETLYPSNTGIGEATKRNIDDFLVQKCGFQETQASSIRVELFKTYGSTLAGLRALGYDIDADDYHSFVDGSLSYDSIKPDTQLRNLLNTIKQRKIIFTNSNKNHAMRALDRLGIRDCFEQIICFETLNPNLRKSTRPDEFPVVLKPSLDAMRIAIEVAGVNPCRTLFLDDSVRNVAAGKAMGLRTALVGESTKIKEADYALETVNNLAQSIPEIWVGGVTDNNGERISRTRSQLDSIIATEPVGAYNCPSPLRISY